MSVEKLNNERLLAAYEKIIEEDAASVAYTDDEDVKRRIAKRRATVKREVYRRLQSWLTDYAPSIVSDVEPL